MKGQRTKALPLQNAIRKALYGATAILMVAQSPGWAQDGVSDTLEEVTVTATRRSLLLSEVPSNLNVYQAEELERRNIENLQDLGRIVPGLAQANFDLTRGGWGGAIPIIRGLNANRLTAIAPNVTAPTISTYYGNALLPMAMHFKDIERIEVLRGPQGTLYGSGSMGGTIQIVPAAPDLDASYARVQAGLSTTKSSGGWNNDLEGMFNWAATETLGFRVLAGRSEKAGFIDEIRLVELDGPNIGVPRPAYSTAGTPVGDDLDSEETYYRLNDANDTEMRYFRAQMRFQPTERLLFNLSYDRQKFQSDRFALVNPRYAGIGEYEGTNRLITPSERDLELVALDAEFDFGFATLTVNASDYEDGVDSQRDWTAVAETYVGPFYFAPYGLSAPKRLQGTAFEFSNNSGQTVEVRLTSSDESKLNWMTGVFYTKQDQDFENQWFLPGVTEYANAVGSFWPYRPPYFGDVPDVPDDLNWEFNRYTEFEEKSVFVDLDYALTERWAVAGGLRYFEQDFRARADSFLYHCNQYCSDDGVDPRGANFAYSEQSFDDTVIRLSTNYRITDDLRAYFNYSEGFRRGGANAVAQTGPFAETPNLLTFRPDTVESYELGLRGQIGNFSFTTDVYYMDWKDPQIEGLTPSGYWYAVVNADSARNVGFDFEANGAIAENLQVSFGYAYVSAELAEDFSVPSSIGSITGSKGDPLPGVPKHSATISLDWFQPGLWDAWDGSFNVNLSYRSGVWTDLPSKDNAEKLDGFSIVNTSYSLAKGKARFTLFVDNIFSELGVAAVQTVVVGDIQDVSYGQYVIRPRTVGLKMSYEF